MKNLFVKTIVVFLAACISLTCSVACNGKPKDSGSGQGDQTDSGYYVVENGSSEYKILLSSDAGENVELAADELKLFIQKSTGVALDIITDNSAAFDASAKYLSLGKNRAFMNTGFSVDDSLGYQGFILKTKDRSVYMCGGGDPGTLYAAYEYLYRIMKFEVFSADECYYEKLDKIAFSDLDFSDKPDIEYRENSYACYNVNSETKANMRKKSSCFSRIPMSDLTKNSSANY